jgi:uncharacterized membrane protein
MTSFHVFVELLLVLELPPALLVRAVECHLGHVVDERVYQISQALDLLQLLVIGHILIVIKLLGMRNAYHDRV